jgi:hypothetical protein
MKDYKIIKNILDRKFEKSEHFKNLDPLTKWFIVEMMRTGLI